MACEFLPPAKRKSHDGVVTDVVGRDLGGVEIDEVKPLAVSEVGLAKQVNNFWRCSSQADIVYTGVAAGKPSRVGRGQGMNIGVKPLQSHAFRKSAFDLDLGRVAI